MKFRKIIWSYWSGDMSKLITKCIDSWKNYANDWEIIILNDKSVDDWEIIKPKNYDKLSHTTKSDVIRLSLLYKYGGVWMDASVMLTESLDWLQKYENNNLYAFHLKGTNYIESWFIFAPNMYNPNILNLLNTFNDILDTSPYTNHIAYDKKCTTDDNYFMIYQAFCYLVNTDNNMKLIFDSIEKNTAFKYFYNSWIPLKSQNKLIKFTKQDRDKYKYYKFPLKYLYILLSFTILLTGLVYYLKFSSIYKYFLLFIMLTLTTSIIIIYSS